MVQKGFTFLWPGVEVAWVFWWLDCLVIPPYVYCSLCQTCHTIS
jgi:hypothetical protein